LERSNQVQNTCKACCFPSGRKPWRGETHYPVLVPRRRSVSLRRSTVPRRRSVSLRRSTEMKTPTAVIVNEQTYEGTNDPAEQDHPEEKEALASSFSLKSDAVALTVPPAAALNNETFIVSSDKYPSDFKIMITPKTDKRVCVPLRSMSNLEIGKTYSVDLDFLIEDDSLPKTYEVKVTQDYNVSKSLPWKSCKKDASCGCHRDKLNNSESLSNNGAFMVMRSPNGKQKEQLSDQSEILSKSTRYCESLEIRDKQNDEELASNYFQVAHEELSTSQKTITSIGDVYPGLVKCISRSMGIPIPRPSVRTRTHSYKSNGLLYTSTILNTSKGKATDSTILKSSVETTNESSALDTTCSQTRAQKLKYSPVRFFKKYYFPTSSSAAKPNANACFDSSHGKSIATVVEGSSTSMVSDVGSSTNWTLLTPKLLLNNERNMRNPLPVEIDYQYDADVCASHAESGNVVDIKPQYTNVRFPIIQASACKKCLAAPFTSNAGIQTHEICCCESADYLCCKPSQHLTQSAKDKTLANIPVVSQKTNLTGNEDNIQTGFLTTKHTTCKHHCSPSPHREVQRNKLDILQMTKLYLGTKKNIP
ncbi:hypothetical protein NDU88_006818, partial [Pleurodeles waltl]